MFTVKAKDIGLSPGSLIHVGDQKLENPVISAIDYSPEHIERLVDISTKEAARFKVNDNVSWINLSGIHDIDIIKQIGQQFDIPDLALEDILNSHHRPKLEEREDFCLIILKMLFFDENTQSIMAEQLSLVFAKQYVITFQERETDIFNGLQNRLQRSNGRIRQRGTDYLTYALIDSVVDSYFHVLEKFGDHIAQLEEDLLTNSNQAALERIHHYRRQLLLLRKSMWPLREVIGELYKEESPLVREETLVFLRDLHDHTIQALDTVELFRDTISGLQDLHVSLISNRMNEIMKVLTIMASIFIPLTFIAGIYGMNFDYIPELKWRWGYFAVWVVMLGSVAGMLFYFRRKRWF